MVSWALASISRISSAPGPSIACFGDFQEVLERMTTQPERPISEIRVSLNELSNL